MAYYFKGNISFGLVYIPVSLHPCIKENNLSFNLLDKKTLTRIKYRKTCVGCNNKEVKSEDIVKGYQYQKDKYVVLSNEELDKLKNKKDQTIAIEQFINNQEIDPIFYNKAYYVNPISGYQAYKLLVEAMESENKVAIAKVVFSYKQTLVALRVLNGRLLLNTLYFYDEITKNPSEAITEKVDLKQLKLAKTIVNNLTSKFDPKKYKDEYQIKIEKAINSKVAGKKIVATKKVKEEAVPNLMEALQLSLSKANSRTNKRA